MKFVKFNDTTKQKSLMNYFYFFLPVLKSDKKLNKYKNWREKITEKIHLLISMNTSWSKISQSFSSEQHDCNLKYITFLETGRVRSRYQFKRLSFAIPCYLLSNNDEKRIEDR